MENFNFRSANVPAEDIFIELVNRRPLPPNVNLQDVVNVVAARAAPRVQVPDVIQVPLEEPMEVEIPIVEVPQLVLLFSPLVRTPRTPHERAVDFLNLTPPRAPHRPRLERQNAFEVMRRLIFDEFEEPDEFLEPRPVVMPNFTIGFPDEGFECSICVGVEESQDFVFHPCGIHLFHRECLENWYRRSVTCPYCRGT